eukprot:gene7037-7780_t
MTSEQTILRNQELKQRRAEAAAAAAQKKAENEARAAAQCAKDFEEAQKLWDAFREDCSNEIQATPNATWRKKSVQTMRSLSRAIIKSKPNKKAPRRKVEWIEFLSIELIKFDQNRESVLTLFDETASPPPPIPHEAALPVEEDNSDDHVEDEDED